MTGHAQGTMLTPELLATLARTYPEAFLRWCRAPEHCRTLAAFHARGEHRAANGDWITHYPSLPNEQVLALMVGAHVGLLPTYADTYGMSVLECQAHGTPVITTNVRALPEMNDEHAGWLIEVPRDDLGEGQYTMPEQRALLSASIEAGLERVLHEIFADRASLRRKGTAALEKIEREHNPADFAARMGAIYQQALG